jgi:hypothetical protein
MMRADWIVIGGTPPVMRCQRCKAETPCDALKDVPLDEALAAMDVFLDAHLDCMQPRDSERKDNDPA